MADNVPITAGTGTDVATDDVAGVHYQKVKLALGAENAVDLVLDSGAQTSANSLPVVIASDQASIPVAATLTAETTKVIGTVNVAAAQTIATTNGGTFAVQDSEKVADEGSFSIASTKVLPVGFLADDASPDATAEGTAAAARVTLDRKLIVAIGESGANLVRGGGAKTDTTDQSIMAAPGSGFFNYLTWIAVYNSSSTNTYANVKEGANTVAVIPLPAYGGAVLNLTTPIRGADNAVIYLAAGASVTTAQLYGGGYKGK